MNPRIRPIKDLYFRFIQPSGFNIEPQALASLLANLNLIELIPHRSKPSFEHYRDTDRMRDFSPYDVLIKIEPLIDDKATYEA